ncbi:MOSC domain-containing protein [Janibacter indicus]|uniref:MOSC domain-containing protein n=1 Tax=Janibacter indicus TaxID=857417 RepID=A0A7L9J3I5_9MICO|nr:MULTISPECIES: MOSC N-terminal beta barrel domain-containing protein [Janibacter]MCW4602894.1 MOSC domain-containing protein [Janibacter hoylei]QOK23934.1 MOSC domain-containing protein [Janibacter indicus]
MQVTSVRVYPVKSLAGMEVDSARVEPWGLEGDRRWGLVDPAGEKVTAREESALLGMRAEQVDEETIRIHSGEESILVDVPLGLPPIPVSHSRQGFAAPADQDVSEWISERVGRPLRLVWQEDPRVRRVSGAHGGLEGDTLSLADAGPLLLTSQASLAQLQVWVDEVAAELGGAQSAGARTEDGVAVGPLDMLRFRPNVVIDGDEPFAEDAWPTVRVGEVEYRTAEVCDRCVMATIDPVTLTTGPEPTRTLSRHRKWDGKTWFGTRLVPLGPGELRVGDEVVPGA